MVIVDLHLFADRRKERVQFDKVCLITRRVGIPIQYE
jgi:hypothetical protein